MTNKRHFCYKDDRIWAHKYGYAKDTKDIPNNYLSVRFTKFFT